MSPCAMSTGAFAVKWILGFNGDASGELKTIRDQTERGREGFTAGLTARRYFSDHVGLSLGLQFTQRQYADKRTALAYEDDFDPGSGTGIIGPVQLRRRDVFNYAELPIGLSYRSNESGKIAFTANAGLSANILLSARYYYSIESAGLQRNGDNKISDLNAFNLSAFASAGVEYRAGARLKLSVAPAFRYGLLSITDAPLKGYLWAAGLQLGASWSL